MQGGLPQPLHPTPLPAQIWDRGDGDDDSADDDDYYDVDDKDNPLPTQIKTRVGDDNTHSDLHFSRFSFSSLFSCMLCLATFTEQGIFMCSSQREKKCFAQC